MCCWCCGVQWCAVVTILVLWNGGVCLWFSIYDIINGSIQRELLDDTHKFRRSARIEIGQSWLEFFHFRRAILILLHDSALFSQFFLQFKAAIPKGLTTTCKLSIYSMLKNISVTVNQNMLFETVVIQGRPIEAIWCFLKWFF